MNRRLFIIALLAVGLGAAWVYRDDARMHRAIEDSKAATPTHVAVTASPKPEPRSDLADALNAPTTDIRADLRLIAGIIGTFRSNFPHDGNPVGSNAEITAT